MLLDAINDASLIKVLKFKDAAAHYLLKLFYNDDTSATNFVGVSDDDRTRGGASYIGIVRSWGSLHQSADIIEFTSSIGAATIILDNTTHAILDGRFTDLFLTKNFANRKWELHLESDGQVSASPICSGIISADIKANSGQVTLSLLNYESKFNLTIPTSTVDVATYSQAPADNIDKPIPQCYGDFDRSVSATTASLDRCLVKGHFPAIITDADDIDAKPDTETLEMLRVRNLYMALGDRYAACDPGNVSAPAADGTGSIFTFGGDSYFIYIPLIRADSPGANLIDEDTSTEATLSSNANGTAKSYEFDLMAIADVGVGTAIKVNFDYVSKVDPGGGARVDVYYKPNATDAYGAGAGQTLLATGADFILTPAGQTLPTQGAKIKVTITGNIGGSTLGSLTPGEMTVEFQVQPKETFIKRIDKMVDWRYEKRWTPWEHDYWGFVSRIPYLVSVRVPLIIERELRAPTNIAYVYFAGQGRALGAWIDTIGAAARATYTGETDPGYASGDLAENPIYIVEEALRTEGSHDEDDIDLATFDISGNATDGLIKEVFGEDNVTHIKFAFSQYQFTDISSFMERVGKQCGTLFFISGSGKIKAATRRRPGDYSAGDEVLEIDYDDLNNINYWRTPVGQVRNDITVKYDYDYVKQKTTKSVNPAADGTSQGTTVGGYKQALCLEEAMDCCLDAVTADNYADALQAWHKDRHNIISFNTGNPRYQALEIGDVIEFLHWDSDEKIYGAVPTTTDLFMVISVTRNSPSQMQFIVMEVS